MSVGSNEDLALTQVWAEVEHGEEQVRILSSIAQASEVHARILQEELGKVTSAYSVFAAGPLSYNTHHDLMLLAGYSILTPMMTKVAYTKHVLWGCY